ncbi:MAG: hypothetical protein K8S54_15985 [Spirochaetia bacterium]|nr:hypothetical protein [Spirochaetia bacterium]
MILRNRSSTLLAAALSFASLVLTCRAQDVRTAPQIDGRYITEQTASKKWYGVSVAFNLCEIKGDDKAMIRQIEANSWKLLDLRVTEEITRETYNSLIKEVHDDLVILDKACMRSASRKAPRGQEPYTPEQKLTDVTKAIQKTLKTSEDVLKRAKDG